MMWYILTVLCLSLCLSQDRAASEDPKLEKYDVRSDAVWVCENRKHCMKTLSKTLDNKNVTAYESLERCRISCGLYGGFWPMPAHVDMGKEMSPFNLDAMRFDLADSYAETRPFLTDAMAIFVANVEKEQSGRRYAVCITCKTVIVYFYVKSWNLILNWNTIESYKLTVTDKESDDYITVRITAETVYGARHALETLSQMITPLKVAAASTNEVDQHYRLHIITEAKIRDKPEYPHRGLLIDTSRNFIPLQDLKRMIDGMAASKMNIFHWHATDTHSFPLESKRLPLMTKYGAYSTSEIYRPSDVEDLLSYARARGIRVIMEIDAPAHAGNGWQWGPEMGLGELAVCVNEPNWRQFCIQPPCGQLNPTNPNVYRVLRELFRDILDLFPKGEVYHMGGDEVFFPCWNASQAVLDFLTSKSMGRQEKDFLDVWAGFQAMALRVYDEEVHLRQPNAEEGDTQFIIWSSKMTDPAVIEKYLPKDRYIIETWVPSSDSLPKRLAGLGYRIVVSTKNAWYLDHGFRDSNSYSTWRRAYDNLLPNHKNVLGGEACSWSEVVDENALDARIWPRAAAVAERLWANPANRSYEAEPRFNLMRSRLIRRGLKAEAVTPQWCVEHEGACSDQRAANVPWPAALRFSTL